MKITTFALAFLSSIATPSNAETFTQYSPSGCVEARFNTNEKGEAVDIFFSKHHPADLFLEDAYTNLKRTKFKSNQKEMITQFNFQNDTSWPLPFECLDKKNQEKYTSQFELNELDDLAFKETKDAIDTMFFQSMYDSFDITDLSTSTTQNNDNSVNITVSISYKFDAELSNKIASHYFKTKYSTSETGKTKYIEILRERENEQLTQQTADEILDYIGQRIPVITIDIEEHRKSIIVGAPLNSNFHCGGNISKREGFKKYCLTHENSDKATVTFKNIKLKNSDNITAKPQFRITNSYLLPKKQ